MHSTEAEIRATMGREESRKERDPHQWRVAVERGPDWLFLRLEAPPDASVAPGNESGRLADRIWDMIRESHAHRVVLELDRVQSIDDDFIGTITDVGGRVRDEGGLIRVCGLSPPNLNRLRTSLQGSGLPHFDSRSAAVGGRGGAIP
jgi:MFS superfamily sulfate permease-like transporter